MRKSIVAKVDIMKGDRFSKLNITTKRPRCGVSPIFWNKLLGKKSKNNYKIDQPLKKMKLKVICFLDLGLNLLGENLINLLSNSKKSNVT